MDGPPFRLLAVCTGNVCRSPAVEARLAAAFGPDSGVGVSSAGLRARVGEPMTPDMALMLTETLSGFAARQVTPGLVTEADLVLGMTRAHRAALVTAVPGAVRKTFTLREFAELAVLARDAQALPADGSPGRRLSAVVAAAPQFRGQRTTGAHDDIEDPYGRELWNYARAMAQINECLTPLVAVLRN